MSNTPQGSTDNESDFVLKHRIVGAAFLLFFGALVLPWMLGPPSEASKDPSVAPIVVDSNEDVLPEDVENEILQELQEADVMQDDEQVYISKITPLDRLKEAQKEGTQAVADNINAAQPNAKKEPSAVVQKEPSAIVQKEPSAVVEKKPSAVVQKKPSANAPKQASNNDNSSKQSAKNAVVLSDTKAAKPADKTSTDKKKLDTDKSNKAAADLAAALEAESAAMAASAKKNKIDVGWIVQVGVFTDKNGAAKVVQDLTKKGFTPATSIVDTNKGKNTGTRVWLGPFAQRAEADKTKTRLTERTGESGFIRAYP